MYTEILALSGWSTFASPEGHLKMTGSLRIKLDESNHLYSLAWHKIVSRFFHLNEIILFKARLIHLDSLGYMCSCAKTRFSKTNPN